MKASWVQALILPWISLSLSACNANREEHRNEARKVTVTTVQSKAVTLIQQYSCQIHSHHHIKIRVPVAGYLESVPIRAGQTVKQDELLFQVSSHIAKKELDDEHEHQVVSIKAPFDGTVSRLLHHQGSVVKKGETLTTLSDNSLIWVYFDVPETRYLKHVADLKDDNHRQIELVLANGEKFDQLGKFGAIGAAFNAETGTIRFRADFPNPARLLRHGQTGTVLISQMQNDAIVVPQRATFEVGDKRFVYVIDKDDVAHQREIVIHNETEDLFVVEAGVGVDDKIVLDGYRQVHDGDKVEYDGRQSKKDVANVK